MHSGASSHLTNQTALLKQLKNLFPSDRTDFNARKEASIKYPTGAFVEIDVRIPSRHLCFEFQDSYHYVTTWYNHTSQEFLKSHDSTKNALVLGEGNTLVVIPCWWDGELESLAETINFSRPDILNPSGSADPIPLNPPPNLFASHQIPDVGELMLASFPSIDPTFNAPFKNNFWWLGEKYDGIRFCWNFKSRVIYGRTGKEITLTSPFPSWMPRSMVDGEFWFGRGRYSCTYMLFKESFDMVEWHTLRMMLFDVASINSMTFERRYNVLLACIDSAHPFATIAFRVLCADYTHLSLVIQNILANEGEGGILRKRGSIYRNGRSLDLIKLKATNADKEGIVRIIEQTKVQLQLPDGNLVYVPAPSETLGVPLKVGDVVTFSFDRYARKDVPSNPKIIRVRTDVEWGDIVENSLKEPRYLNERNRVGFTAKPIGHWTAKTMRLFFEKIAKKKGLNPLLSDTWYSIPRAVIARTKGGTAILKKFKGYFHALKYLFPDLRLSHTEFLRATWREIENRRKFFEKYALDRKFDPLVAGNWYMQSYEEIEAIKGAARVLYYHNYKVSRALIDLFPNIGLDESKLPSRQSWSEVESRKQLFISYAEAKGFDPLNPISWYSQQFDQILSYKGMLGALYHHNRSIPQALLDLFPDIGLEKAKLRERAWMNEVSKRQEFFVNYAKAHNFDPLIPENWYSQSIQQIMSFKGAPKVMLYYQNRLPGALLDVFPDIGLEREKFYIKSHWYEESNRRKFLEEYARSNGFDPLVPEHWYSQSLTKLTATKYASNVMYYHNRSMARTIIELFPEVNLKTHKFKQSPWSDKESRKRFFEKYAQSCGFDPLVPENWYSVPKQTILALKGMSDILYYHKNRVSKAIIELFPNVEFDRSKFRA